MKLDNVVKDSGLELTILENIRRCSKIVGKTFKVIFWHENLTEQDCKDFIERNEHLLFEVHTQLSKRPIDTWFIIYSPTDKIDCRTRYRVEDDDILSGISRYLKVINHLKNKDNE
tara:strand:+ start:531 stop:875 length:345 start_codon:yes stop_codon:yes gene_type:complete